RAGVVPRLGAFRQMHLFRAQRGAPGPPAAAPQGGRTLCEPTCRDNNRLGRNRSGPIACEGAVLNPIWRRGDGSAINRLPASQPPHAVPKPRSAASLFLRFATLGSFPAMKMSQRVFENQPTV